MFEYNGTQYTLAQVEEAASKTDMSLEDYISKYNITKIEKDESAPEVESPVNKNETENKSKKTSIRGAVRKREVEKQEEGKINEAQGYYLELQKKLKNVDPKDTDSFFQNTYFDLANIPTKPVPSQTFGYGAGGTTNEPIPIEEYLGDEKFKQYEQFLNEGSAGIVPLNEENSEEIANALVQAQYDARKQTAQDFINDVPTHIKNIMPNSAGEFKSVKEATESLKLISKGIDFQKEDYEKNIESFKKQDEEFAGKVKTIESQLKALTNDEGKLDSNSSPETISEYQNLVGQYEQLTQEYEKAGLNKLYNDLIVEGKNINSSVQDFQSKLKAANLEDRKVIEDALKLDYSFGTRAGIAIEDFFAGGLVNTALLTGQVGVRTGELIRSTNFLNLWGTDQYDETQYDEAVNFLKTTAQNYNAKLAARKEKTIPEAYTLDDLKRKEVSFMDWFSNAFADNSPSIITTLATGGVTAAGRAGLSTATTFAARRAALQTAKKTQQYGLRTAQGVFFTAETGGKYGDIELIALNAEKQLPFLKVQLAKTEDLEERSELEQQIEDLETKTNYTLTQKAFTSYGSGGTAMYAETFGSLRFVQGVGSSVNQIGRKKLKKEFYENGFLFTGNLIGKTLIGLGKTGTKAGTINLIEEGLTLVGQNAFDRYILKENKSLLEGLDKDFIASTLVTSIGMFAPRAAGNLNNLYKNEFQTRENVLENQKLVGELIKIYTTKKANGLKGKALREANKRQNEIIKELGLNDALNLHKIRYLSEEEIREVGDLNRRIHQVTQEYNALGKIGDPKNEKNKSALERLNSQLNELVDIKESILNKGKKQHRETVKRLREKYGPEFRQARAEYYLGVNSWAQDVAMLLMPEDGEFTVIEDEKGLENLINKYQSEEAKKKIREGYNQGNYAFNINNDIIIFQENTYRGIGVDVADSKYAAISPLEELFHIYNKSNNIVDKNGELSKEGQFAVDQAINVLKEKNVLGIIKISDADYNNLIKRFELYKDKKGKKDHEELLAQLNNAVSLGILDLNDFTDMPSLRQLINGISNDIFGDASWMLQMNSSDDVFKFIQKYQQNIKSEVSIEGVEEEDDKIKESKQALEIDKLVGPKVDNKYLLTKQEWDAGKADQVIVELYEGLQGLIKSKIPREKPPGFSQEDFVSGTIAELIPHIRNFNPEQNNSLSGWINSQLQNKIGNVFKKGEAATKDVFEVDVTEARGVAVEEAPTPTQEKSIRSKLRRDLKIDKPLIDKVKQTVRKTFGTKLPEIESKEFKQALQKAYRTELKTPLAELLGTRENYKKFLEDNFESIYKALPQDILNKRFRQFAEDTGQREKTPEGKKIFKKRSIDKQEFVDYFLGPDVGTSTKGTRKDALAEALGEIMALDATMEVIKEPEVKAKREAVAKLKDQKVTKTDEAKIGKQIDRDPGLKFSKAVSTQIAEYLDRVAKAYENFVLEKGKKVKGGKANTKIKNQIKTDIIPTLAKDLSDFEKAVVIYMLQGTGKDKETGEYGRSGMVYPNIEEARKALNLNKKAYNEIKKSNKYKLAMGYAGRQVLSTSQLPLSLINQLKTDKSLHKTIQKENKAKREILFDVVKTLVNIVRKNPKLADGINHLLGVQSDYQGHFIRKLIPFVSFTDPTLLKDGIHDEHYSKSMRTTRFIQSIIEKAKNKSYINKELKDDLEDLWEGMGRGIVSKIEGNKFDEKKDIGQQSYIGESPMQEVLSKIENPSLHWLLPKTSINPTDNIISLDYIQKDGRILTDVKNLIDSKIKASKVNNKSLPLVVRLKGEYTNQMVLDEMAELDKEQSEAQIKFSKSQNLSDDFNKILENKTGIGAEKIYSDVKAQVVGANKGRFNFFVPPSAEDFVGLLYKTLGKGKVGDAQMAWYKKHLLDPFARAMDNISRDRIALMNDFKTLKKDLKIVPKNLKKKLPGEPFTQEQAIRTYIWNKQGMSPEGMSKKDIKDLTDFVESKPELVIFADQLITLQKGDKYPAPKFGWLAGNITTDLMDGINTIKRTKYLEQWQYNVDDIFTKPNLNKLEAAYGKDYRTALENILKRMRTGRNREFTSDSLTGRVTDWLTNSIGAIMFFNTRSAVLQTISAVNFINFQDNNILAAGKAFANQPQFWKDFITLFNSDFLVDRRNGLRLNVNEADIADMAKKGGVRGVISELLRIGFLPTQIADSFAIASGGSTFYRNRVKKYTKEGMSKAEAENQAFIDFREIAEESQQSSRPDRISMQQAGPLGRVILAFANTPMQYTRLIKKAASDLKNGRGDPMTNISKILYYGFVQNLFFNAMQQALFAMGFGDEEEETEKREEKYANIVNSMSDSILRGTGVGGAIFSVLKNTGIKLSREADKKSPKYQDVLVKEIAQLSPPVSSKLSKLRAAGRSYSWNKKEMMEKGFSLDNPAYLAAGQVIAATTNVPLDRAFKKIDNIRKASSSDYEAWARIAMLAGWSDWELGVKKPKIKSVKKKKKKTQKKPKKRF